jgi:hypothetical protein
LSAAKALPAAKRNRQTRKRDITFFMRAFLLEFGSRNLPEKQNAVLSVFTAIPSLSMV